MALETVIKQILSLFLIGLVGFYGGRKKIIDENISNGLSRILLDISIPLLIISSFSFKYTSAMASNVVKAFIYGIIIFILTPLLVKPLLIRVEEGKRKLLEFAMVFSNCGFMGFPLAQSVLGYEGVIYTSVFNIVFNIFVWTYGVVLLSNLNGIKELKNILKNPGIIAAVIGILVMVFSIKIPGILLDTMKMLGGLTTPVSMLIIGSQVSRADLKKIFKDVTLYYGSFIKLLLIPIVLYLVSIIFKEKSLVIKTFILLQAMPAGATTSLFAENFNKDKEYAAFIVSFSTLLSVITIPLVIKFFL